MVISRLSLRDRLAGAGELMDLPVADRRELEGALEQLAWTNRHLGGARLVLRELMPLLEKMTGPVRILDVGTGSGDIPRAIARAARERGIPVEIEALERHETTRKIAARASVGHPEVHLVSGDALALPYPEGSFDVVMANLVLHHMEGEGAVRLLRELRRVARRVVLVSDLRRGPLPYLVTRTFLHLFSRNRLIRYDGPLSVRRAYTPEELLGLGRAAGWEKPRLRRHPFFRMALVEEKG